MSDIESGAEFLRLFGELETGLRRLLNVDKHVEFSQLLKRGLERFPSLRNRAKLLLDIADLRNVIAHGNERVGRAIPTAETIVELRDVISSMHNLTRSVNAFIKNVTEFSAIDPIAKVLTFMSANDFSQVPVRRDGELDLLTAIDIAEWLAAKVEEDIISIAAPRVDEILRPRSGQKFAVVSRSATLADIENKFLMIVEREYESLFCVVITQNGRPTEKALGIVTPWDLMHLPPELR